MACTHTQKKKTGKKRENRATNPLVLRDVICPVRVRVRARGPEVHLEPLHKGDESHLPRQVGSVGSGSCMTDFYSVIDHASTLMSYRTKSWLFRRKCHVSLLVQRVTLLFAQAQHTQMQRRSGGLLGGDSVVHDKQYRKYRTRFI